MKTWIGIIIVLGGLVMAAAWTVRRLPSLRSKAPTEGSSGGKVSPVIVELFTSEGCSSCPPADAVLSTLDQTQPVSGAEIIVLSEHVDYWNDLGWADPFSAAGFSDRQRWYADAFQRDGLYTPQMVVDGQDQFNGSDLDRARSAIAKAARFSKATVELSLVTPLADSPTGKVALAIRITGVPKLSSGDTAEVMLAVTENGLHSSVSRGENAGRGLTHTAVARSLTSLGPVVEGRTEFTAHPDLELLPDWNRANLRAVVFVQELTSRRILGAEVIDLSSK